MLEVDGVSVVYGQKPAVSEVSVRVERGEVVSLVGPNGAGKTSLLSSIFGLAPKASGAVRFDGRDISQLKPEEVVRAGIALVPEGRHILGSLTVEENLRLAGRIGAARDGGHTMASVHELFPVLERYGQTPAGRLSGGEQQQLAIARGLLAAPELLLLDEPSLGLAPQIIDLVFEVMGSLRARGITVFLVEQNAKRALAFADRSYVMVGGRIVLSGTAAELVDADEVVNAYLHT